MRVLVVEDDGDANALMSSFLRSEGYDVESRYNGFSALEALPVFKPDIIVLDLDMPGMDGYEYTSRARLPPHSYRGRAVLVSADGEARARYADFDACFDAYLVKPVDWEHMSDIMRSFCRMEAADARIG